jgi:hypothetical protein
VGPNGSASLDEGTHYIDFANDYNELWALNNPTGSYPTRYDLARESCGNESQAPPGEISSVPFIVDRTDPIVGELGVQKTNSLTYRICGNASDTLSGLRSIKVLAGSEHGLPETSFTGQMTGEACHTIRWEEPGWKSLGIIADDWAWNGATKFFSVYATTGKPASSPPSSKPFKFKLIRKRIFHRKRVARLWFKSNLARVKFRCAFAGQPSVKCSSPMTFTHLTRRNTIVLTATDARARVRTIVVRVRVRGVR